MITRFPHGMVLCGALLSMLCLLVGCGNTVTVVVAPTAMATSVATATATIPPATATPASGVCDAADFPTKFPGGPDPSFQYPPLTYHGSLDGAAGNEYYGLCSSGDPASILAFLEHSIPAGGWTVTATTATTLNALHTSAPQDGFCASVDITVGTHPGFPGEWGADFHPPAVPC